MVDEQADGDTRVASHALRVGVITFELPEGRSTGTAFLISRCEIMTNFHVVFGPWYVTALKPPSREQQGRFTIFAMVDALTRMAGEVTFAGERAELDQKAAGLQGQGRPDLRPDGIGNAQVGVAHDVGAGPRPAELDSSK